MTFGNSEIIELTSEVEHDGPFEGCLIYVAIYVDDAGERILLYRGSEQEEALNQADACFLWSGAPIRDTSQVRS